jgi:CHASE3 domain sensor protein
MISHQTMIPINEQLRIIAERRTDRLYKELENRQKAKRVLATAGLAATLLIPILYILTTFWMAG